ncbi:MAG: HAD-IIIC family phosphatase [Rhizobiaceae bacterium]
MTYIGMFAAEVIAQLLRPRIKAIITDLDNTVWGGVVGDDGPENLALDPDGDGRSFVELQRMLVDLSDQGIPISVSSKNTDLQARRPFEERPEMVLGLNDIVYFEASWNAKHLAIQKIAQQLNLGLDAICFLDDSPHERAEARAFLPDLVVPELPEDPEQRVDFLRRSGLFMTPRVLEDDLKRVRSYRENARRQVSAEQSISIEDYLRDLEIKLIAEPLSQANLPRAASLIQKTNQFNLTLARTQKTELANLINDPTIYSHLYSVIDRFGDSGQVALLVAKPTDSGLKILEWVMSCRVFSRHIEHATLTHLGDWAKLNGHTSIIAPYEATDRNGLVADFLDAVGFSSDVDHGNAEFRGDVDLPIEHFAEITNQRAGTRDRTLQ